MDYRALLKKYISHVLEQNGTDFLSIIEVSQESGIDAADYDELCKLAYEVDPL